MNKAKPTRREMLLVNGREIPVAVVRSRRARRYILRLREDGLARLTIPRSGSAHEAWAFVQRQGAWLERQLQHLAARPVRSKEWRVGTEILFRGERIKIEAFLDSDLPIHQPGSFFNDPPSPRPSPPGEGELYSVGGTDRAALVDARASSEIIPVADTTGDLRPAIERHLRALATRELPARTLEFAALHQLSVQRVAIRAQRSRWGSCSFKGVISLNWRLIQTPPFVSDYIILHELMHLRQMNHSARFWREVEQVCPDRGRTDGIGWRGG